MTDIGTTVLGYPRIGPDRELKRALERYWAHDIDRATLLETGRELRERTWRALAAAGLDSIPSNTFSHYDHVLDTAELFGALPGRFTGLGLAPLDTSFAAARGVQDAPALEMTKWFDTNYHYLVPELGPDTAFTAAGTKPLDEYLEARALGLETRPVLVGPVTFLLLAKSTTEGFRPLDLLDTLLPRYADLLRRLHEAGAGWVQLDEPAFAADRTEAELNALIRAYHRLGKETGRPKILVTGSYGRLGRALGVLARAPIEALAVDLVSDESVVDAVAAEPALRDKEVLAGVVDGRNVWRTDPDRALARAATLLGVAKSVSVTTSCSLLHVPYDVEREHGLPPRLKGRLAFARQKVDELVLLGRALRGEEVDLAPARQAVADRATAGGGPGTPGTTARPPYAERAQAQQAVLGLPPLPTTTIGSFPQTTEVRKARAAHQAGTLDDAAYEAAMRAEIERVVRLQEDLGLDVLVHGEPERNDMVQYFAEQLAGFATTAHGWVQSYGSRCVRPPILHGDVSRPAPMTVPWTRYAQSLTAKPVKGMLTGPVTILAWSFVRDDQPLADTARQVALAVRDEVRDLEAAGIRIVQVDEPALRELLPLRRSGHEDYLRWAVAAFRLATSGAGAATQIHTHLCYSEFGEVLSAIDALDADVTSIEAARSRMEVVAGLTGFGRGVGPGVYDIHSPRVPDAGEIGSLLRTALAAVPPDRLWVNPDCGLKTRGYGEVAPALGNLVAAVREVRAGLA
ncbi:MULTISPECIES: 5-methyltetrahydropteroyltriglutamate--homocysteine S-methyltransferase [unclassified Amycolatopsis]|uniref:5-methyltetrahydropteroyltriglutamate-- homocysteine S-methyltransferase n=1 Tax=unclassified Amycolatopsis TaxID=2618356 RepID=UPI00287414DB|nr:MULTISPECIES: 5-methyltetrahydropteroyltriglutamate--homocysteine S-methyltransferase [unclassified Amycolatopsis]MDS0140533.1 5-methyltetrahydropteroyltriglutamate--homocysteine S-methyltransferase [Amycolatopsis sp. 505]MDS0148633.1 5-methyltetrahydropteroyltriglutamate--homocysteine S-methyltransferase [Amycolatopsis sp. CM201R]